MGLVILIIMSILVLVGAWFLLKKNIPTSDQEKKNVQSLNRTPLNGQIMATEEKPVATTASNIVDLPNLKVGDSLVGLTVASLRPFSSEPKYLPMSENNVSIKFNGKLTLTGEYTYNEPKSSNTFKKKDLYITITNASDLAKIPILKGDDPKKVVFRFEYYDDISKLTKMFSITDKKTTGTAVLSVEGYTLNRFTSGEASNLATLIEIKEIK